MGVLRSRRAAKITCFATTISRWANASSKLLVRGDEDCARNSSMSLSIGWKGRAA